MTGDQEGTYDSDLDAMRRSYRAYSTFQPPTVADVTRDYSAEPTKEEWSLADAAEEYGANMVPRLQSQDPGNYQPPAQRAAGPMDPLQAQAPAAQPKLGEIVPSPAYAARMQAQARGPMDALPVQPWVNPWIQSGEETWGKIAEINRRAGDSDSARIAEQSLSLFKSMVESGADGAQVMQFVQKFYTDQTGQTRHLQGAMAMANKPSGGGMGADYGLKVAAANRVTADNVSKNLDRAIARGGLKGMQTFADRAAVAKAQFEDWKARGAPVSELSTIAGPIRALYTKANNPGGAVSDQEGNWISDSTLRNEILGLYNSAIGTSTMDTALVLKMGNNLGALVDNARKVTAERAQGAYYDMRRYMRAAGVTDPAQMEELNEYVAGQIEHNYGVSLTRGDPPEKGPAAGGAAPARVGGKMAVPKAASANPAAPNEEDAVLARLKSHGANK